METSGALEQNSLTPPAPPGPLGEAAAVNVGSVSVACAPGVPEVSVVAAGVGLARPALSAHPARPRISSRRAAITTIPAPDGRDGRARIPSRDVVPIPAPSPRTRSLRQPSPYQPTEKVYRRCKVPDATISALATSPSSPVISYHLPPFLTISDDVPGSVPAG